jgi:5-oxopent-3-ene-1,2,5-tricarboxylate decarboxylase/2-hydroxyhepta-2,4-diene-1,7-dioate isomerase
MLVGVALNSREQVAALAKPPKTPVLFIKPESTLAEHEGLVQHPDGVEAILPGPALAVVLGAKARRVAAKDAFDFVKGCALFNDFSLPEKSYARPPVRAKGYDSFGPLGRVVVDRSTLARPEEVTLRTWVNGKLRQESSTRNLVWGIDEILAFITTFMTLEQDDGIAIGFPPERIEVRAGDTVTIEAPRLGELTSHVVTERAYRDSGSPPSPRGSAFLALGLNYRDHAAELSLKPPEEPLLFLKSPSSLTGNRKVSCRPDGVELMHYEGELVVVVGRDASKVKREEAIDYVSGYTLANDYAVRDYLEDYYRPNLRAKSRDGLTPVGPRVVDAREIEDPHSLEIRTYVNGELRQKGSTRDMVFDIPYLLEYVSSFMTLRPGDRISTGTPKGLSNVLPGDEVVVEVDGIGRLENRVVSEEEWRSLHE